MNEIRKDRMKKRLKESRLRKMNLIPDSDKIRMAEEYKATFAETATLLKSINPSNSSDILTCL